MLTRRFLSSIGSIGIDIQARGFKMLQLGEHRGELFVVGAASVDVPATEEEEVDQSMVTARIRTAFVSGRFSGSRCVMSLPPQDVCVQSTRLPSMTDEELGPAAVWEASQRFGFARDAMEVDYIRTSATVQGGEDREEVLLIVASHEVIRRRIDPFVAAGLRPTAVETSFTALSRAFSRQCQREVDLDQVRAVVDVSTTHSTVMILRGCELAFCKVIATGAEHFDQAVADHLQMDLDAAQELRAARLVWKATEDSPDSLSGNDSGPDRAVYEAIRPLLGSFAKEVMLCIRYYGVMFRGHPPQRLILTGSEAREPRLDETLGEHCDLPVVFNDDSLPLKALVDEIASQHLGNPGPVGSWAAAAGLSLRGLNSQQRANKAPDHAAGGAAA